MDAALVKEGVKILVVKEEGSYMFQIQRPVFIAMGVRLIL